jgi:RhtB (resistance to homoserine/threonine) family protein
MSAFLTVAIIHFLAVVSPGPDFAIVTKNSLAHTRKAGVWTAAGVGLGLGVHTTYSLLGIGLVISQSILLFNIIKYVGAAYLIYIGVRALLSKKHVSIDTDEQTRTSALSARSAFMQGFLCNVLNPKATLFMLALFTQVIDQSTPLFIQGIYGAYMSVATFVWFSTLASVFSMHHVRSAVRRVQHRIEQIMGVFLIGLGLKVALSGRD